MGIGNTTPSAAIIAAITRRSPRDVTGRGTGIDDARLATKISVIERALAVNEPDPSDALDVLAKVGGFEIGGLAGVILAAAAYRIPVVIDGVISSAAALIATTLAPQSRDYLTAGHLSVEPGHGAALEYMKLEPVLDLGMRLGEGTGGVLAMSIIEAAVKTLNEMATFHEAGVSEALDEV
jgi:nicotinate-nucleotide--dimethylbenzimidazole phosphoribosyltransferase